MELVAWEISRILTKLEMLMLNISDDEKCSKLKGLYNYLSNQDYIVYEERKQLGRSLFSGWVSYRPS